MILKNILILGCTIDKGYPVGSFRVGLFLSNNKVSKKKYDICIISSNGRCDPNSINPNNRYEL